MKIKQLVLFGFLGCTCAIYAQEKDSTYYIFTPLEIDAAFPGGDAALHAYIREHLVCPPEVTTNYINATCYLQFEVTETGQADKIIVLRGVTDCPQCDQAAVKVIAEMPRWQPQVYGRTSGITNETIQFTIPIHFSGQ